MIKYKKINCNFCGKIFQPYSSRGKHCSAECRFKDIASDFDSENKCWEWPLSKNIITGYGQFNVSANPVKLETAHRISYKVFKGKIPKNKLICHSCDNRWCFNPSHLFVGTHKDNSQDMLIKGRYNHNRNRPRGKNHWRHKSSADKTALLSK